MRITADLPEGPFLSRQMWARLRSWHRIHGRHHLPWRHNANPWGILLAETLLHRTKFDAVEKVYPSIIREFSSPEIVRSKSKRWLQSTRSLGLAWRAQQFVLACKILVEKYGGRIPSDEEVLLHLPGIGHYIASTVRCFGFGIPTVIVDTNTIRLASRISGCPLDPSRHRRKDVHRMIAGLSEDACVSGPEDNYALIDLASLICFSQNPRHPECPLAGACATAQAGNRQAKGEEPAP